VVIVNYRSGDLVRRCLESLCEERRELPQLRVVVADNASGDASTERLAAALGDEAWRGWARLERLPCNGGFAYANNAVIRGALAAAAPPDCFVLLNPDTWVRPGGLARLLGVFQQEPRAGLAGPRIEWEDGRPQCSAFRFPSFLGELEAGLGLRWTRRCLARWVIAPAVPQARCRVDWLSGACLAVRREVFEALGLLDERFFLYYEEVDLCRRARAAGWQCWYAPESRVVHLLGSTTGWSSARPPDWWLESRREYFLKHHGRGGALLADLGRAGGMAASRVVRRLVGRRDPRPPELIRALLRHSALLPAGRRQGPRSP